MHENETEAASEFECTFQINNKMRSVDQWQKTQWMSQFLCARLFSCAFWLNFFVGIFLASNFFVCWKIGDKKACDWIFIFRSCIHHGILLSCISLVICWMHAYECQCGVWALQSCTFKKIENIVFVLLVLWVALMNLARVFGYAAARK